MISELGLEPTFLSLSSLYSPLGCFSHNHLFSLPWFWICDLVRSNVITCGRNCLLCWVNVVHMSQAGYLEKHSPSAGLCNTSKKKLHRGRWLGVRAGMEKCRPLGGRGTAMRIPLQLICGSVRSKEIQLGFLSLLPVLPNFVPLNMARNGIRMLVP